MHREASAPAPPAPGKPGRIPSTLPDRVLVRARELFNRHGVAQISSNALATDLAISPGNLNYHFRTKRVLIHALLDALESAFVKALEVPDRPAVLFDVIDTQIRIQSCLWNNRFFFGSTDYLASRDVAMAGRIERLESWVFGQMEALWHWLSTTIDFLPIQPPNSVAHIGENSWMLWVSWVRHEMVGTIGQELDDAAEAAIVERLLIRFCSFLAPMFVPEVAARVNVLLEDALRALRAPQA